jgi:hypothetical protein
MNKVIKNIFGALLISIVIVGCKKDVQPELILTVQDELTGQPLKGIKVAIFANELDPMSISYGILDSGLTDASGKYRKSFPNTVVLDVAAFVTNKDGDTLRFAKETFKIEEKRQKSKDNFVRRTIILPN